MDIKKFRHACLVVRKNGQSIVIDPGIWTSDLEIPNDVTGVIITHEHSDHFDIDKVRQILDQNPEACIYAHVSIIAQLQGLKTQAVSVGETIQIGNFTVEFVGGEHAVIQTGAAPLPNLGLLINGGEFYYPGDSFALPGRAVQTLALPISAPWLKISEVIDFLSAVRPGHFFPTHDALLSPEGYSVTEAWLKQTAKSIGTQYQRLPS